MCVTLNSSWSINMCNDTHDTGPCSLPRYLAEGVHKYEMADIQLIS